MKKMKRAMVLLLVLALCLGLTACSSTLGKNTGIYFSEVGSTLRTLFNGNSATSGSSVVESNKTALNSPANFTVDADGNYSFESVEGASYYLLYFCDSTAVNDNDDYIYVSSQIDEDGSGTYTGSVADYFQYAYNHYLAKVVAHPSYEDKEYTKSAAATCEFTYSGTVETPEFAYRWNGPEGTLDIQLINVEAYEFEAFPDQIEIELTNASNSSDVVTLQIEGVSLVNDVYSASSTDLTPGCVYQAAAKCNWNSDCVSNQSAEVEIGEIETSMADIISDGYGYLDSACGTGISYPVVGESFNLADGGSMGVWHYFKPWSSDPFGEYPVTFTGEDVNFIATPAEAVTDGSAYSYLVEAGSRTGKLEIYTDGTFVASLDPKAGMGPFSSPGSQAEGTWVDNGDGTVNLYYDHATVIAVG